MSPIVVSDVTGTSATITWSTDELATTKIEVGLEKNNGYSWEYTIYNQIFHCVIFRGLTPNTLYYYKVSAEDVMGNGSVSGELSFTTKVQSDGVFT